MILYLKIATRNAINCVRDKLDKNIIGAPKMRYHFWYPIKMIIFQYCEDNIGLFSIAPHLVIALLTLQ